MKILIRALALLIIAVPGDRRRQADRRRDRAGRVPAREGPGRRSDQDHAEGRRPGPRRRSRRPRSRASRRRPASLDEAAAARPRRSSCVGRRDARRPARPRSPPLATLDLSRGSGADALKHAQEAAQLAAQRAPPSPCWRAPRRAAQQGAAAVATRGQGDARPAPQRRRPRRARRGPARRRARGRRGGRRAQGGRARPDVGRGAASSSPGRCSPRARRRRRRRWHARPSRPTPGRAEAFAVLGAAIIAGDPKKLGRRHRAGAAGRVPEPAQPDGAGARSAASSRRGGNLDQATAAYRKALEARPDLRARAAWRCVQAQVRSGQGGRRPRQSAEPRGAATRQQRRRPAPARPACSCARATGRARRTRSRRRRRGCRATPRRTRALGFAYQYTRRTAEALAAYKKAVELDPKNLDYRTTYGIMLGINKDYAGGVAELNKVIATPGYKSAGRLPEPRLALSQHGAAARRGIGGRLQEGARARSHQRAGRPRHGVGVLVPEELRRVDRRLQQGDGARARPRRATPTTASRGATSSRRTWRRRRRSWPRPRRPGAATRGWPRTSTA